MSSDLGFIERVQRRFSLGRRVQRNHDKSDGPWLRGVHLPIATLNTLLLIPPAVLVYWLVSLILPTDTISTVTIGLFLPIGWVLYHVLLGVLINE